MIANNEAQKFDSYGKEWWEPEGRFVSLHRINPLRFSYFSGYVADGLKGKKVLDIGCGGGILSEEFAKAGAVVTGIDLSPVAIDSAKEHAKTTGLEIDYKVASASHTSHLTSHFDIVICAEVLEHVDNLEGFIKDAAVLLKNKGYFFFSTINKTLSARFFAIFIAENILNMVPKGTHDFKRFIRPSQLVEILRHNNITALEIKGMTFNPMEFEFKISDNTNINYMGYGIKEVLDGNS